MLLCGCCLRKTPGGLELPLTRFAGVRLNHLGHCVELDGAGATCRSARLDGGRSGSVELAERLDVPSRSRPGTFSETA